MNTEPASTDSHQITVQSLTVEVVRKSIKNLHLGVYPPDGRVRVAAPVAVSDDAVRLAVLGKLGWIKRKQAGFHTQPRQSQREMVSGESHYFQGRRYRLHVIDHRGAASVALSKSRLELHVRSETTAAQRERVLQAWYREQLKEMIQLLLDKWQPILGVEAADWGVRKMKTKWGTCSVGPRRIWLNLELAKKPAPCVEYLVVHELLHLVERRHNDRFRAYLDHHLPQWRLQRDELNRAPLRHEDWQY